jgi:DnaK suppressor protein
MESEGLARTVELQRRRVRDALDRLDGGTYGRCEVCGREIDDERLEARPEASTCREHTDALTVDG